MYGALPNAVYAARTPPATPSQTIPTAASEPHESPHAQGSCKHKHPQERSIVNRSGQQYPGEIATGGRGFGQGERHNAGEK